jgi:type II secretory pathway pseudopilin PulG
VNRVDEERMMHRTGRLRGISLLEVMMVSAVAVGLAAAGGSTLVEQARRSRAVEAANNALLPHTVARDRAVSARTCTETVLVPPLPEAFTPAADLPAVLTGAQKPTPQIAMITWSACTATAVPANVEFFDLGGPVSFTHYSTTDERLVFDKDGALTATRPGKPDGGIVVCGAAGGGFRRPGGGGGDGTDECKIQPPPGPPPDDVTFEATTYFGDAYSFKVYARLGSTELQR